MTLQHALRHALLVAFFSLLVSTAAAAPPKFEAETIDDQVKIGYGVAIGDVNGDGKPDILLADKNEFVWYQNPTWKRWVMTADLTPRDNVCLAARDIDGDGKVEVAVGAAWNPGDTVNSGSVHYLQPPADRTQPWTPIKLHHEPVVHRMRWAKVDDNRFQLIVAPLHGRGNRNGEGAGVKLLAYEVPADVRQPWPTTVIEDTMHVTHNFDVGQWDPKSKADEILYLGREGAMLLTHEAKTGWAKKPLERVAGGGEIRFGRNARGERFLVTIEPFHGERLVYYPADAQDDTVSNRVLLDDGLKQGHAIAVADLFGNGEQQIVAGWRQKNAEGNVGVKLYFRADGDWQSKWIDQDGMATEDLRIGDLDGDGRPDIVAAGRATQNLKIYWNKP